MEEKKYLAKGSAALAPMAGVTDMPFRVLCHEMGCPMAVSEMLSAKGYVLSPRDRRAQRELLAVAPEEEGAVALQIFGHEPEVMAQAAEELTRAIAAAEETDMLEEHPQPLAMDGGLRLRFG